MASSWKVYNQRHKVIARVQQMARSGQRINHSTIILLLEGMDGFEAARTRFEDRAIRALLDRLCTGPAEAPQRASTQA